MSNVFDALAIADDDPLISQAQNRFLTGNCEVAEMEEAIGRGLNELFYADEWARLRTVDADARYADRVERMVVAALEGTAEQEQNPA